jgi:hypothetical protein
MCGEEERCMTVWLGEPEGKKTLERSTRRRDDNIKMYHQ